MMNLPKIIFGVIILFLIYFLVCKLQNLRNNNKLEFYSSPDIEYFTSEVGLCPIAPQLLDVNYERNTNKTNGRYYVKDTQDTNFSYIIDSVQPFHNSITTDLDFDEIGEVRQSEDYVWVLNIGRNKLMRGDRKKLKDREYTNVLNKWNEKTPHVGAQLITAWGVSDDEMLEDQWACLFMYDQQKPVNSYFVLFKAEETGINIFVDITATKNNTNKVRYIKKDCSNGEETPHGQIFFHRNKRFNYQLRQKKVNYYTFYYVQYNNTNYISNLGRMDYDIDKIDGTSFTFNKIINGMGVTRSSDQKNLNNGIKNEILILINQYIHNYYEAQSDITKYNTLLKAEYNSDVSKKDSLKQNLEDFDDLYKFIEESFPSASMAPIGELGDSININNYYDYNSYDYNSGEKNLKIDQLRSNRSVFYKYLCNFVEVLCNNPILSGIIGLNVNFSEGNLDLVNFENSTSNEDVYNIKMSKDNLVDFDKLVLPEGNNTFKTFTEEVFSSSDAGIKNITLTIKQEEEFISKYNFIQEQKLKCIQELHPYYKDFDDTKKNLHFLSTFNLDPMDGEIQYLNKYYQGNYNITDEKIHHVDKKKNVIGILELSDNYKKEPSPVIKNNIRQPRKVLYTLYHRIVNKSDKDSVYFGRVNTIPITLISSECIPAQKFNYNSDELSDEMKSISEELAISVGKIGKDSLYQYFIQNMLKKGDNYDPNKFLSVSDWIHIYDVLRGAGLYNIEKQDGNFENIDNSFQNNPFFKVNYPEKWTEKHRNLIKKGISKIYDADILKNYPNILIIDLDGKKLEQKPGEKFPDKKVYLHLKFDNSDSENIKFTEDIDKGQILDSDYHLLKLEFDFTRGNPITPSYSETIAKKIYDFYKFMINKKNNFLRMDSDEQSKFVWIKREIHDFNDYKELLYGDIDNEDDPRDRLRGLYEIGDIYIDDKYIDYLETSSSGLSHEKKVKLITDKKLIRDKNMVTINENGTRKNLVGYPFIVFFKYIDYNGFPCEEVSSSKQKIFLTNRLLPSQILKTLDSTLQIKNIRYPLITQEFLSFSGYGKVLQYYENKFGGITKIDPKRLCDKTPSTFIDMCSRDPKAECNNHILSYVSLFGTPKCEIDDPEVLRENESPAEVLVPRAVSIHACDVYILKGNMKIYFSLGKIFSYDKTKHQIKGIYTVRTSENKYLYVEGNKVLKSDEKLVLDPLGQVTDKYKFKVNFRNNDNYGEYFILEPYLERQKYLTAKINLFQYTLGKESPENLNNLNWSLEEEKKEDKRHHLNDENFYSQKFNMNKALVYNTLIEGVKQKEEKEILRNKRILDTISVRYFPDLAIGDKTWEGEPMTDAEEQQALERLLTEINVYLKNINNIRTVELQNLPGLKDRINKIQISMTERVPLIKERLNNIKFSVKVAKRVEIPSIYSEFKYPVEEDKLESQNNISDNIKKQMEDFRTGKMVNALQAIKNFIPQSIREPKKCKKLYEGFEGILGADKSEQHMKNHIVDKYNDFVTNKIKGTSDEMGKHKDYLFERMKKASTNLQDLKMDGNIQQVKISQEIEKGFDMKDSVYKIREAEHKSRINRLNDKLDSVNKLRCQLDQVTHKQKVKDHPHYNSIVSREDGSLLNVYKINKCDKLGDKKLDKNMIFVNGGCLSYDDETMKMNVEHCMVSDEKQHFYLNQMKAENDLNEFHVRNTLNPGEKIENAHYIISKDKYMPPEESGAPETSKYSADSCNYNYSKFNEYKSEEYSGTCNKHEAKSLCLHSEEGNLSMRNCNNIKKQQWDYSDITGPCK